MTRRPQWAAIGVRTCLTAAALGLAVLAAVALPASAAPVERFAYQGADSWIACDRYPVETTYAGRIIVKGATPATDGQFFSFQDRHEFRDVISNPDTGAWMVLWGHGLYTEHQARLVEGSVFTFRSIVAGQPFVMEDSSGRVVVRDVGNIIVSYVFDTGGDSMPGGDLLEEPRVVRVAGPHPAFDAAFDFCGTIASVIG